MIVFVIALFVEHNNIARSVLHSRQYCIQRIAHSALHTAHCTQRIAYMTILHTKNWNLVFMENCKPCVANLIQYYIFIKTCLL